MPQMLLAIVDTWRSPPRMSARVAEALIGERGVALDDSEVETVDELPAHEVAPELPGAEARIAALLARGWGTPARSLTRGLMATGMSYATASEAVLAAVKSGRVVVRGGRMVTRVVLAERGLFLHPQGGERERALVPETPGPRAHASPAVAARGCGRRGCRRGAQKSE